MKDQPKWTTIAPAASWFDLQLAELWSYRTLVYLFVRRDFVAIYKQTILGPLWFVLQPLATTLVFTVVFGRIAKIPTDGVPSFMFYLTGLTLWNYFAACLTKSSGTFIMNAAVFSKVYFQRLTVPISSAISSLLSLGIQLSLLIVFGAYFMIQGSAIRPNLLLLAVPLLILQIALLGLGFGFIIAALTTKYRDLAQAITFGVQLWLFALPIVYPVSQVPSQWRVVILANPVAPIIELFRMALLGVGSVTPLQVIISVAATLAVLIVGVVLFRRTERTFADTV